MSARQHQPALAVPQFASLPPHTAAPFHVESSSYPYTTMMHEEEEEYHHRTAAPLSFYDPAHHTAWGWPGAMCADTESIQKANNNWGKAMGIAKDAGLKGAGFGIMAGMADAAFVAAQHAKNIYYPPRSPA